MAKQHNHKYHITLLFFITTENQPKPRYQQTWCGNGGELKKVIAITQICGSDPMFTELIGVVVETVKPNRKGIYFLLPSPPVGFIKTNENPKSRNHLPPTVAAMFSFCHIPSSKEVNGSSTDAIPRTKTYLIDWSQVRTDHQKNDVRVYCGAKA
ncbi:hypothetical protein E3N88_41542 [Mikania micrantha]|uniref:Uncharacterized protein n=1 Tax=Mikania micrantha TaxID=192012 RepID=A0A5N6LL80_9ASTR|nr:hypothetical protein E3N88_41542 [Mikania micrantha]